MDSSKTNPPARSGLVRKLETASNVAVLVAAVLVVAFFANLFFTRYWSPEKAYSVTPGTRLSLPQAHDFTIHDRTLILAVQEDCSYCEASMPFYRQIAARVSADCTELGVVAVLPNTRATAFALLDRHGLDFPTLAETSLISLGITGTPTLVLVDKAGTVLDMWVGQLTREAEQEVLAAIAPIAACS